MFFLFILLNEAQIIYLTLIANRYFVINFCLDHNLSKYSSFLDILNYFKIIGKFLIKLFKEFKNIMIWKEEFKIKKQNKLIYQIVIIFFHNLLNNRNNPYFSSINSTKLFELTIMKKFNLFTWTHFILHNEATQKSIEISPFSHLLNFITDFFFFFVRTYRNLFIFEENSIIFQFKSNSLSSSYFSMKSNKLSLRNYYLIFHLKGSCISTKIINQVINLQNCIISFIFSSGNGGAIFINTSLLLSLQDTTFYECSSSCQGGAIYFTNGLNIQLIRICGLNCRTTSVTDNQFAYFLSYNDQILSLTTISKCSNNTFGYTTLCLAFGNQNLYNSNISYNHNIHISGIYHHNPNKMLSTYNTFNNNSVSSYKCIHLQGTTGNISKTNFILNNSPTNEFRY